MSGRMLLAFALTFVVILITQQFMSKYYKKPEPQPVKNESVQQSAPSASATSAPNPGNQRPAPPSKTTAQTAATKQASAEPDIVIENDLYKITLTNKGAQAKSWILKKYQDDKGNPLDL